MLRVARLLFTSISVSEALARCERPELLTRVIFLLNITKVGNRACQFTSNLVVVVPEGVESISYAAFASCRSLATVSFLTTLISIDVHAFNRCSSLDNFDLLHTNLQELGHEVFATCSGLKSMTIPDLLQTLGGYVFFECSKQAPFSINVTGPGGDKTAEVVDHLRFLQSTQ